MLITCTRAYLRAIVKPLESLLIPYPKIMIKDTAVNAICYGGQLTAKGVLKYDDNIDTNGLCVIITAKGEEVALATPLVAGCQLADMDKGVIAKDQAGYNGKRLVS